MQAELRHPRLAYLQDHVVGGACIMPGAAYMSIAGYAARLAMEGEGFVYPHGVRMLTIVPAQVAT